MTQLGRLAELVGATLHGDATTEVLDVVVDSRQARASALFCCVSGERFDGHDYAADALASGAVALLCERRLPLEVAQLVVPDTRAAMGHLAAEVHGRPSERLRTVGVTGTNGKTTVVTMVAAVLESAGIRARALGTLTGERTTPEAPDLQRQLAALEREGVEAVATEISSHALVQHRVDGLHLDVGVFTMLGEDHLDFHGTPEAYFAAKARLFEPGRCEAYVVNLDDVHGRLLRDGGDESVLGVGLSDVSDLVHTTGGSSFTWRGERVQLPLPGRHNVTNALLSAETCRLLGVEPRVIAAGLSSMGQVPGRFERFVVDGAPTVVVDYAHTPDALEAALGASREMVAPRGRVTVVFGCGGDRDRAKRARMGAVASAGADRVVLTDDNPRTEDPDAILAQILDGTDGSPEVIRDRAAAIAAAIDGAGAEDLVLVAGKGHEQGQVLGDRILAFDDREVVRRLLAARGER